MLFIDKRFISDEDYVALAVLLNLTDGGYETKVSALRAELRTLEIEKNVDLERLQSLIDFSDTDENARWEAKDEYYVVLNRMGVAFLVNYASEYLERIAQREAASRWRSYNSYTLPRS